MIIPFEFFHLNFAPFELFIAERFGSSTNPYSFSNTSVAKRFELHQNLKEKTV